MGIRKRDRRRELPQPPRRRARLGRLMLAFLVTTGLAAVALAIAWWAQGRRERGNELGRQFRTLADSSSEFVGMCDENLRPFYVNAAGLRMVGLDDLAAAQRTPVEDFFFPEDRQVILHEFLPRVQREGRGEVEIRFRNFQTGEAVWVIYSVVTLTDQRGAVRGFGTVTRNITERRRAEEALRDSEQRFRTLADNISQFAWMADAKGWIFWYNQRWYDYTGTTLEQMRGWGWRAVHHPDHVDRVVQRIQHSWDTGEVWEDTFPLRGRDGTYRWFLSRALPIRDADGRVVLWFGTNTDITERLLASEALATAERQLRLIANHAPVMIAYCDAAARYKFVNRPYAARFGLTPEEVVGRHLEDILGRGAYTAIRPYVEQVLNGTAVEFELDLDYKTGGSQFMHCAYAPERTADGAVIGFVAAIINITDRKQAEERLREADRRKDEFLATLAHELRNPLAPIRNSLEIMKRAGGDAARVEEARATMDRQTAMMERLIDDLLDVSRITRNRLELRRQTVELASVLHHAVEASRPLAERAGQTIAVAVPDAPIYLDGDPARLAQVFSNLLNNACKFTGAGGHIALTATRQGDEAVIAVRDDGIGIAAEMLPTIFEMFMQVDRALEATTGGLGIGLTLAKQLVDLHGGSVTAASDGPGRGSVFTVRLPLQSAPAEVGREAPAAAPAGTPRRILVVDDNRDSAESLALLLAMLGHETRIAHDGLDALEAAERFRPDVMLLDIGLPKLNGYEACRRIREQAWGRQMMIVALTGWGQDDDRRRSSEAGFDEHLVKPVDYARLTALLATMPAGA